MSDLVYAKEDILLTHIRTKELLEFERKSVKVIVFVFADHCRFRKDSESDSLMKPVECIF